MIINHNIAALNTYRQLSNNNAIGAKSLEKLSSGLRINRAGDDAAGLAISEKMRGQIRGLDQASRNAQDTISLIQTAEGALNETHSILQRMRELAAQAGNDTNTTVDRNEIQKEIDQLISEIDRIGNTTEFNTQKLLNGDKKAITSTVNGSIDVSKITTAFTASIDASVSLDAFSLNGAITITKLQATATYGTADFVIGNPASLTVALGGTLDNVVVAGFTISLTNLTSIAVGETVTIQFKSAAVATGIKDAVTSQIGANSGQTISIGINDMRAAALGVSTVKVDNAYNATAAVTQVNRAIEMVSAERSKLGAYQNRLEHTVNNLGTASENLSASESRIRDVDMAKEMMEYTKMNILTQAAQAMLAQANQQPQGVLQLLR
ncbi:flagellin N-terminal helical domain-containing protein [Desulfotruncus alcoholivorax]|nr:flagellin [Desulfotruncus alcoholivorax]